MLAFVIAATDWMLVLEDGRDEGIGVWASSISGLSALPMWGEWDMCEAGQPGLQAAIQGHVTDLGYPGMVFSYSSTQPLLRISTTPAPNFLPSPGECRVLRKSFATSAHG